MIPEQGIEGLDIQAMWLPPKTSSTDPLAQRGYLAIKFSGGMFVPANHGDTDVALADILEDIERRCRGVLEKALANPDKTVGE